MGINIKKSQAYFEKAKQRYMNQVNAIIGEEGKLKQLMKSASVRLHQLKDHPKVQLAMEPLMIFKRMIYAHKSGEHKLSMKTLGLLVLGILYFVTPIDFIPDFLPVIGYADDISVIIAIFNALKIEVEEFLEWERVNGNKPI
ncbi:YkvA family protein [Belliella kenyensis]|uniref:YkvA family protein n=1 Tax=Belliella kenyensis TaxID=1472724 RepID=A0ABV8EKI7_9BACT|nr:DUF1232 domain-containing protein [Belliella kenyensis]MCH7400509.1 DUF1232 domain-containing protein [Belliella kenyensis]MDN3604475.1 YkvA family protein [Belliella kenyensis]